LWPHKDACDGFFVAVMQKALPDEAETTED
jgi:hypothetical protein